MQNCENWLITGGCGFIGTALIKNLMGSGQHRIRVLDNLSVGSREDLGRVCAGFLQHLGDQAFGLLQEREQDVLGIELVVLEPGQTGLGLGNRFLGLLGETVDVHSLDLDRGSLPPIRFRVRAGRASRSGIGDSK